MEIFFCLEMMESYSRKVENKRVYFLILRPTCVLGLTVRLEVGQFGELLFSLIFIFFNFPYKKKSSISLSTMTDLSSVNLEDIKFLQVKHKTICSWTKNRDG